MPSRYALSAGPAGTNLRLARGQWEVVLYITGESMRPQNEGRVI